MKVMGKKSVAAFIKAVLDVFWYVAAICLGMVACLFVVSLFLTDLGPNVKMSLPVSFNLDSDALLASPSSGREAPGIEKALGIEMAELRNIQAEAHFPIQKSGFFFATLAAIVIALSFVLWILTQLRHVFRTLRDGRPFVSANAVRIRWIGLAIVFGELARAGIVFFWSSYFSTHFTATGARILPMPDLSIATILHGLVVLVIAEVIREGARIEEDRSLTI